MNWEWKGEVFPLKKGEYETIKEQLLMEQFGNSDYDKLDSDGKFARVKARVKEYCKRAYNSVKSTKLELKSDVVCMRENSFYVDTVRAFRDRRYEFKNLVKVAFGELKKAEADHDVLAEKEAEEKMSLYESL